MGRRRGGGPFPFHATGERIKAVRIRERKSQREMPHSLGFASSTYGRFETGAQRPSVQLLKALHDVFGVLPDDVLGLAASSGHAPRLGVLRQWVLGSLVGALRARLQHFFAGIKA